MDARGTLKMNSLGRRGKRKGRPEDRWRSLRRTTTARGLGRRSVRRHDSTLLERLCPFPLPQAHAASPIPSTSGKSLFLLYFSPSVYLLLSFPFHPA